MVYNSGWRNLSDKASLIETFYAGDLCINKTVIVPGSGLWSSGVAE